METKINIINATPHSVVLLDDFNNVINEYKPSGLVIRVDTFIESEKFIDRIKFVKVKFTDVYATLNGEKIVLPEYNEGKKYIVSQIVKSALDRNDFITPNELVRDQNGVIIGCKSFSI